MKRRNWKTWVPRSPCASIEGCVEHGTQRYNRGVERLAIDHLGQTNQSSLYKWMANGRLPLCLVVPLEKATGIPLITRYLAAAHGKLLIDIPTGRTTSPKDVQQLQTVLHDAVGALLAFHAGSQDRDKTLDALRAGLESLAWHHGNVTQHETPQLELGDSSDE
ncbi:hypothetical protein ACM72P_19820 [Pseudomonas aeruginosa]|uniref:hypothetical protein n=1 Tax=Pseudomonas aeruginosa TaxID=287 RepID=UPI0005C6AC1B|nr:hypothetical protein [Pseudomonas aeruginosa]EIU3811669.1 hypothetical protein [Pseudomonas aeruginosa]EIU3911501.1 hypothetical protein [Pseudomonas aeruginosa]EIU3971544.1 hypothetical protein [Pseudomonas aeruginosa]MBI7501071.1 hypothetical protein [Pseudomonas aeruginosa]MBI8272334.1 hypothetical protein [Pseudomonas aeruginosa]